MIAGTHAPEVLAELAKGRRRAGVGEVTTVCP
jgi:hypothetical protein